MKHLIKVVATLFTAVRIAGSIPALAEPGPTVTGKANPPQIKFSEAVYSFGKIKSSDVLRHDFIVTNTGGAPLEIRDVKPACGCTTTGAWDRRIQPGQTGKIPIQFTPARFNGSIAKTITVISNDPAQAVQTLQIQATVWHPVEVQPAHVYFTPIAGEDISEAKVVRILSNVDEPLTLDPAQCSNPAFKLDMKTLRPGKEFELRVNYAGAAVNTKPQGTITIRTSSTDLPIISIGAIALVQQAMTMMPPQITLPAGPLTGGYRHFQMIRNNSPTPVKLTEAAINAKGVTVEIVETQPGKMFRLNVGFPRHFQALPGQPLMLTVHTSHPRHPVITVPIKESVTASPAVSRPPGPAPFAPK